MSGGWPALGVSTLKGMRVAGTTVKAVTATTTVAAASVDAAAGSHCAGSGPASSHAPTPDASSKNSAPSDCVGVQRRGAAVMRPNSHCGSACRVTALASVVTARTPVAGPTPTTAARGR